MFQTREQITQSIKQRLATHGRHLWSVDDDQDSTLITVDCYEVNGQQVALQQQFRKSFIGRKIEYQLVNSSLFQQTDISGRLDDVGRKLDQLLQQSSDQRQPA